MPDQISKGDQPRENIPEQLYPGREPVQLPGTGSLGSVYEIRRNNFGYTEKAVLKVIGIPRSIGDIEELYSDGCSDEGVIARFQS